MDKNIREEELKDLEDEIDKAVETLFVPKPGEIPGGVSVKAPDLESPAIPKGPSPTPPKRSVEVPDPSIVDLEKEMEMHFGPVSEALPEFPELREPELREPELEAPNLEEPKRKEPRLTKPEVSQKEPILTSPAPVETSPSLERLESQLLALEWEITPEHLEKARREVHALRGAFRGKEDVSFILGLMDKVVGRMISHGDSIGPSFIKFLMDAKDTIKLLTRMDADEMSAMLGRLSCEGIKARFSCLEGPSGLRGGEELSSTILRKIDEYFHSLGQGVWDSTARPSVPSPQMNVTVFQVEDRFFGVPSETVCRLFKLPSVYSTRFSNNQRIRLREMDITIVDLKGLFSLRGTPGPKETRMLVVGHQGGYKGLMIGKVLDTVSARAEAPKEHGGYSAGMIRWTFLERPVEVLLLDLNSV
jgi:chemotaxis signal transduction protein